MTLAERQLVSRGYARLQQLAGGGTGAEGSSGGRAEGGGAPGAVSDFSKWNSRPAAASWRKAQPA